MRVEREWKKHSTTPKTLHFFGAIGDGDLKSIEKDGNMQLEELVKFIKKAKKYLLVPMMEKVTWFGKRIDGNGNATV